MKKRISLFIALVMACMLAMPAMAAPTLSGATPEEVALYHMGAAGQGLPAFAKDKLGAELGAMFVAAKEASAPLLQHGYGAIMAAVQAIAEDKDITLADALSLYLEFCRVSYNEARGGTKMYDYGIAGYFTLATQDNAHFYMYFTDGYQEDLGNIPKGSGYYSEFFGIGGDEDWYPGISIRLPCSTRKPERTTIEQVRRRSSRDGDRIQSLAADGRRYRAALAGSPCWA